MSYRGLVVLAAALVAWAPALASACSPPSPFGIVGTSPRDGAMGVPTNVQARVVTYGTSTDAAVDDVVIRPAGGAAVDATVTVLRNDFHPFWRVDVVRPKAPLLADADYEIAGRVMPGCTFDCITTTYQVLATFHTGPGPDTKPPVFGGATGATIAPIQRCESSGCCGPYVGILFTVEAQAATDDSGIAGYNLYADGTLVSVQGTTGFALCSGNLSGGGPPADFVYARSGRYTMRAVDLAGNEDANDVGVAVTLDCAAALAPDAGAPDASAPDASAPDGAAPPDAKPGTLGHAPSSGGCATGGGLATPGTLLLVAALLWRRRTSSSRSR